MPERYRYVGDETGTDLENGIYDVVHRSVDNVLLRRGPGNEVIITKEEFRSHVDMGTLKPHDV